jgi:hypothetical protein
MIRLTLDSIRAEVTVMHKLYLFGMQILEAKRGQVLVLCEEELSKVKREFCQIWPSGKGGI